MVIRFALGEASLLLKRAIVWPDRRCSRLGPALFGFQVLLHFLALFRLYQQPAGLTSPASVAPAGAPGGELMFLECVVEKLHCFGRPVVVEQMLGQETSVLQRGMAVRI